MNVALQAISTYGKNSAPLRTSRGIEYEIFAQVTHQIKSHAAMGKEGFPALAQSLHTNRNLWTTLAADVADPENELPAALKAQVFYLAEFTNQHTRKVLSGSATVDALTDINLAIMRGLASLENDT